MTEQAPEYDLYPLTVIRTRYSGSYEGGRFAAFPVDHHRIPSHATGDDTACAMLWGSPASRFIGVGESIAEAITDLQPRIAGMSVVDRWRLIELAIGDWCAP